MAEGTYPNIDTITAVNLAERGEGDESATPMEGTNVRGDADHGSRQPDGLARTSRGRSMPLKDTVLLDIVLDQMADGVIIADATGRLLRVNPAAARMHGRAVTGISPEDWTRTGSWWRARSSSSCRTTPMFSPTPAPGSAKPAGRRS
jgi:PAS domain-containing protein